MTPLPSSQMAFDWPIYADATFAGLSVLFPIPLADWLLEEYFRRRMPRTITRYRHHPLPRPILQMVSGPRHGCLATTLRLLLHIPYELLKRLVKKLLYILTIKEATDRLSYYWQQAFLLDYMLAADHLTSVESARQARQAMEETLKSTSSPLVSLAKNVLASPLQVMRLLRRAFHSQAPIAAPQQQNILRQRWATYHDYLQALAVQYDQRYHELAAEQQQEQIS